MLIRRQHFSHHAPHGQIVQVHLVKPAMPNGVYKQVGLRWRERRGGARFFLLSQKGHVVSRVAQRVAAQSFAERVPLQFVEPTVLLGRMVNRVGSAVGQFVILVRLLRIGIRADLS